MPTRKSNKLKEALVLDGQIDGECCNLRSSQIVLPNEAACEVAAPSTIEVQSPHPTNFVAAPTHHEAPLPSGTISHDTTHQHALPHSPLDAVQVDQDLIHMTAERLH